jgi:hypothetical protein
MAFLQVGRFRCPPRIGLETLCLWPKIPGWQAEAGDFGPQEPETPVRLAKPWFTQGLDDAGSSPELGQRLWSLAGDSGAGVT